ARGWPRALTPSGPRGPLRSPPNFAEPVGYFTIGRKGRDFIYRRGGRLIADFSNLPARPSLLDTTGATRTLTDDFLDGKVDEVYLVYTEFRNLASQRPVVKKLLPLAAEDLLPDESHHGTRP